MLFTKHRVWHALRDVPTPMSLACACVELFTFEVDLPPKSLVSGAQISAADPAYKLHMATRVKIIKYSKQSHVFVTYGVWRPHQYAPTPIFIARLYVKLFTFEVDSPHKSWSSGIDLRAADLAANGQRPYHRSLTTPIWLHDSNTAPWLQRVSCNGRGGLICLTDFFRGGTTIYCMVA